MTPNSNTTQRCNNNNLEGEVLVYKFKEVWFYFVLDFKCFIKILNVNYKRISTVRIKIPHINLRYKGTSSLGNTLGNGATFSFSQTIIPFSSKESLCQPKIEYGVIKLIIRKHILNCTFQEPSRIVAVRNQYLPFPKFRIF
jgi:hypothetical protein